MSAASSCAGESGGISPVEENRSKDRIKYGSNLVRSISYLFQIVASLEQNIILAIHSAGFSPRLEIKDAGPDIWVFTLTDLSLPFKIPYWLK